MRISDWSSDVCSSDLLIALEWAARLDIVKAGVGENRKMVRSCALRAVEPELIFFGVREDFDNGAEKAGAGKYLREWQARLLHQIQHAAENDRCTDTETHHGTRQQIPAAARVKQVAIQIIGARRSEEHTS